MLLEVWSDDVGWSLPRKAHTPFQAITVGLSLSGLYTTLPICLAPSPELAHLPVQPGVGQKKLGWMTAHGY